MTTAESRHLPGAPIALAGLTLLLLASVSGRFWLLGGLWAFAPGYLLERWARLDLPLLVRPAVWLALSLSCLPLLYLWVSEGGFAVSPLLLWLLSAGLLAGVGWRIGQVAAWRIPRNQGLSLTLLLLCGLVAVLTIWNRATQIDGLAGPVWVDSVHHGVIIEVIARTGRIPYSLRPFLPLDNFIYHWGYHTFSAALLQASGVDLLKTMLWGGQLLGALAVVAYGGAAVWLWRRPLAWSVAAITVAFISILPAFFLSWGRYTLLTGLLLLPAVLILTQVQQQRRDRRATWLLALVLAGLMTIHILVTTLALLWCLSDWLTLAGARLWQRHGAGWSALWRYTQHLGLSVGIMLLATAPWLARMLQKIAVTAKGPNALVGDSNNLLDNARDLLFMSNNHQLINLAIGALVVLLLAGLDQRRRLLLLPGVVLAALAANPAMIGLRIGPVVSSPMALLISGALLALLLSGGSGQLDVAGYRHNALAIALWTGMAALVANPVVIGLPYVSFFSNNIVVLTVFVPAVLLISGGSVVVDEAITALLNQHSATEPPAPQSRLSAGLSRITGWLRRGSPEGALRRTRSWRLLRIMGLAVLATTWAIRTRQIVSDGTIILRPADLAAIEWVATNTPPDAHVAVNTEGWKKTIARGSDGGWWLLPLTGRQISTPPVLFTYGQRDYIDAVVAETTWLREARDQAPQDIADWLRTHQYTFVYATSGGRLFNSTQLAASPLFIQRYTSPEVSIFELAEPGIQP